jgi:hypothetical protein
VGPSPEIARALELRINLYGHGAAMDAAVWLGAGEGTALFLTTGFRPIAPRVGGVVSEHWRLRPGRLAALILGDVAIQPTEGEQLELRAVLEPLGIEVFSRAQVEVRDVEGV